MTDSTALTRLTIDQIELVALRGANSGQFGYAKPEQAFIAVLAGQEVGIGPFAAMNGIHMINGKPVVGAHVLARLVKASGKYDYRITKHDDTECVIAFFEGGDHVGDSRFTMGMAQRAGLAGGANWKKSPENMLFARAISNGVKWFTPDVTAGPFYVEGEIEESLPTPPPAPARDIAAVVEAEEASPARWVAPDEPATPTLADVKATLAGLSSDEQKAIGDALKAAGVKSAGGLAKTIVANLDAQTWGEMLATLAEKRSDAFPDDLPDVQNAQPERERPSAVERQAVTDAKADDETEAMFGEAYAAVASVPAYGENAAS